MNVIDNPSINEPINFNNEPLVIQRDKHNEGFENVKEIFNRQLQRGLHPGAQLVVLHNGRAEIDLSGGYTDSSKKHPVAYDTRFLVFSITKPFISACIFKLVDEELLDLSKPVGYYWPEFSSQGKEEITIRQVMLHQAGLPNRGYINQLININDWQKLTQDLARQKPQYKPGSKTAYHSLNFGYILGEVIHRVSGRYLDEFLEINILDPLGLRNTGMRILESSGGSYARLYSGTLSYQFVALFLNSKKVRAAIIPAASLHSTAREMAIFFQMLLNYGTYAGRQILNQESVKIATSLGYEGFDDAFGRNIRWGYGFFLGGEHILNPELPDGMGKGSSIETFGHFGQRTAVAWADRRTGTVVVFLCNRFLSAIDYKVRLREISDAVWDAVED